MRLNPSQTRADLSTHFFHTQINLFQKTGFFTSRSPILFIRNTFISVGSQFYFYHLAHDVQTIITT